MTQYLLVTDWITKKEEELTRENTFSHQKFLLSFSSFESFQRRWLMAMVPHIIFLLWLFQPLAQGCFHLCFYLSCFFVLLGKMLNIFCNFLFELLFGKETSNQQLYHLVSSIRPAFSISLIEFHLLNNSECYKRLPLYQHPIWKWYLVLRWYHTGDVPYWIIMIPGDDVIYEEFRFWWWR